MAADPDTPTLEELFARATPGPWRVEPVEGYTMDYILTDHPDYAPSSPGAQHKNYVGETGLGAGHPKQNFSNDAALIVALVNQVPAILKEREALRVDLADRMEESTILSARAQSAEAERDALKARARPVTLPTIAGTTWVLMRVGNPVGVQNYGKIARDYAFQKAKQYVAATPGEYELVEIEHIEREVKRFPIARALLTEQPEKEGK